MAKTEQRSARSRVVPRLAKNGSLTERNAKTASPANFNAKNAKILSKAKSHFSQNTDFSPAGFMSQPTSVLTGVGAKTRAKLTAVGIDTAGDLLYELPRTYENFEVVDTIGNLKPGKVVVRGRVVSVRSTTARSRRLTITTATVSDGTGELVAVWFNQPYRERQLRENPGQEYYFEGEFNLNRGRYQLQTPKVRKVEADFARQLADEIGVAVRGGTKIIPVYRAHSGFSADDFRRLFQGLRADFAQIPDLLPDFSDFAVNFSKTAQEADFSAEDGKNAQNRQKITENHQKTPKNGRKTQILGQNSRKQSQITAEMPENASKITENNEKMPENGTKTAENTEKIPKNSEKPPENDKNSVKNIKKTLKNSKKAPIPALSRTEALFKVHFPENAEDIERGRKYLAFEEVFELVLAAALSKNENHRLRARPLPFNQKTTLAFTRALPFQLTPAQKRAGWEILQDLGRARPMNRLLQGDVGSGKTAVAALAVWQAVHGGAQVAFLAPTAILATQHCGSFKKLLAPLGVRIALLTGAAKRKSALRRQIEMGEFDLVVGTHALITDTTKFHNLGLVVIDEQHRFGVAQRQKLLLKSPAGLAPHLLAMTATPIPRSLQLAIFGDLDISVITQLPKGRRPVTTKILPELALTDELYPQVRATVRAGEQVYWICRHIDDDAHAETAGVKSQARRLSTIFPEAKIAYLHGRMKPDEKERVMGEFAAGKIDILVSTTVVEVGVDVPSATLIVIAGAEDYGLAQLHQLRGRVGRGDRPSFCYLVTSGDGPSSRRLRELEKSRDGFYLADVDLKLRGPGEIYGSLQHGALNLRIASLADTKLIALCAQLVREFLRTPGNLANYPELKARAQKYQQLTLLN